MNEWVQSNSGMTLREKTKYSMKILFQWHFVHHKSNVDPYHSKISLYYLSSWPQHQALASRFANQCPKLNHGADPLRSWQLLRSPPLTRSASEANGPSASTALLTCAPVSQGVSSDSSVMSTSPLKPSGHYMYQKFNIQQFYVLPTQCIYVFCVDLRTNSDYFPVQH